MNRLTYCSPRVPLLGFLLVVDFGFTFAYLIYNLLGQPLNSTAIYNWLDLDNDSSFASWYSSMQLFCLAAFLGVVALHDFFRKEPKAWLLLVLAVAFLLLSLDEVAKIHETLGGLSDRLLPHGTRQATVFKHTGIWMFLFGAPFSIALLACLLALRRRFSGCGSALFWFASGAAVWLGGALGIEALSNLTFSDAVANVFQVFIEETLELAGVSAMVEGAVQLAAGSGISLRI